MNNQTSDKVKTNDEFSPIDITKVDWNKMTPEQFRNMETMFQKRRNEINRINRQKKSKNTGNIKDAENIKDIKDVEKTRVRKYMENIDKSAENDPRNIKKAISIDGIVYEVPITIYIRLKEGLLTRDYIIENFKPIVCEF